MCDYDKLFARGNILGIEDICTNTIYVCMVDEKYIGFKNGYANDELTFNNGKIQYIIRLDQHGNVVEKFFDRKRDMNPMPELRTGMMIQNGNGRLGVVVSNKIVYQKGGWNYIDDFDERGRQKNLKGLRMVTL